MKTIRELSESIGISKESIYKKIKFQLKTELEDHVFKGKNGTLIDDVGQSLILQSLRRERDVSKDDNLEEINKNSDNVSTFDSTYNQPNFQLDGQVENTDFTNTLKQQLIEKDKQIVSLMNSRDEQMQSKDKQIEYLLKINEQLIDTFQNEQKIRVASKLQLQGPAETEPLDESVQEPSGLPPKKSIWDKLFKK